MLKRIASRLGMGTRDKTAQLGKSVAAKTHAKDVRVAADRALKTYDKTFKDLARYDRGDLTLNPVSR